MDAGTPESLKSVARLIRSFTRQVAVALLPENINFDISIIGIRGRASDDGGRRGFCRRVYANINVEQAIVCRFYPNIYINDETGSRKLFHIFILGLFSFVKRKSVGLLRRIGIL